MPKIRNNTLGINTETNGSKPPFKENILVNLSKTMYAQLNPIPIPKLTPIPPLTF